MTEIKRTIPSLTPNTKYIVRVRALNSFGIASNWSEALLLQTPGDNSTPNGPTNLVINFTSGDLVLGWDPPANNTDGSIFNDFKNYEITLIGNTTHITRVYTTTAHFFVLTFATNDSDFGKENDFNIQIKAVDISDHKSTALVGHTSKGVVPSPDVGPVVYRGFTLLSISLPTPTGAMDIGAYLLETSTDGIVWTVLYDGPNSAFTHEVTAASKHYYRYKIRDSFSTLSPSYSPVTVVESLGNLIINYGNYCVNSSFEIGPDIATAWRIFGAGTPVMDSSQFQFGAKSQQLTYSGSATCGVEQTIVLPIDTTSPTPFTASFYVRTNASGRTAKIEIRDEINNNTYDSSSLGLTQNAWTRISFTQTLPAGVSKFFIRCFADNAATSQIFWFDGAQVEQTSSATTWAPRAIEIPDNYIQSAHIAELSADKISTGSISTAVISMADDGVIQSFNGASGYQLTATGATFQNGYVSIIGASGSTIFDSTSLRAIYSGNTKFLVNSTGVYIGGNSNATANVYFEGSKTVFQDTSGAYDFIIDTSQTRIMRLTNGVTDNFFLDKNGNVGFAGAISGSTIDIGTGATSFHVDINGNLWSGSTSYSTAPFKVSNTGDVTGASFLGNNTVTSGSSNFLQSSNFSSGAAGWRINGDGNAEFNNVNLRGQFSTSNGGSHILMGIDLTYGTKLQMTDINAGEYWIITNSPSFNVHQFFIRPGPGYPPTALSPSILMSYDNTPSPSQINLFADDITVAGSAISVGGTGGSDSVTVASATTDIGVTSGNTTVVGTNVNIHRHYKQWGSPAGVQTGSVSTLSQPFLIYATSNVITADGSGVGTVSFPSTFPNAVICIQLTYGDTVNTGNEIRVQQSSVTTSGFSLQGMVASVAARVNITVFGC